MNKIVSNCPLCGERALHVLQDLNKGLDNQQCINCGYVTSTTFKLNEKPKEENDKYKTLTDEMKSWSKEANDRVWIPTIMTLPVGMLYPTDVDDVMKWAFAPMIEIPEEERKNFPNGQGGFYEKKIDTDNPKIYDKFLVGISYINEIMKNKAEDNGE